MNYPSPRTPGSTPIHDWEYSRMSSATPTPPPRPNWFDSSTPRRPATRAAHTRATSFSQHGGPTPRTHLESPRYNSYGDYCTVDVSAKHFPSSRRTSAPYPTCAKRDRRHSHNYAWPSTPYGESDEDETIEALGRTYVLPAQSYFRSRQSTHPPMHDGGWYTNPAAHPQSSPYYVDAAYARATPYDLPPQQAPTPLARPPTRSGHGRRASTSVPQRPATARPVAPSHRSKPAPTPAKATEDDARRHGIPAGFQLKNWDPNETPIRLLGSVFDAHTLGKWIYDWTVYAYKPGSPIADMSGELWLLLLKMAENLKRAEEGVGRVRGSEKRDTVSEFIESGERLWHKLDSLLKACEAPMLQAAKKKGTGLGKTSGVEFVNTLFGRERELGRTEKFMQSVRTFNLRFDANCTDILRNPTA
ncbi:hypothetical protein E4U42_006799 [Claviceps africana]|uniref:Vegetative cell wall protein gp1 n=1 Tax=Claviceps africana TaxID=83212 RepID=A0A8K0J1V8_9HYPO|nr:hypothetical protein E4U42_006799 [Claviceps africana]